MLIVCAAAILRHIQGICMVHASINASRSRCSATPNLASPGACQPLVIRASQLGIYYHLLRKFKNVAFVPRVFHTAGLFTM